MTNKDRLLSDEELKEFMFSNVRKVISKMIDNGWTSEVNITFNSEVIANETVHLINTQKRLAVEKAKQEQMYE